jgi:hydroxyacylglutathione hydrolase
MHKIADDVWKISADGNVYLLTSGLNIIVDTSSNCNRNIISKKLNEIVDIDKIDIVIFTHMHYDHTGDFNLFPKATFYASQESIRELKRDLYGSVLNEKIAESLKNINLKPIGETISCLSVISTPGHTRGSICLFYGKQKILFSGDTLFENNHIGRTDLPTSVPEKMEESLTKIRMIKFKTLCPGHDY